MKGMKNLFKVAFIGGTYFYFEEGKGPKTGGSNPFQDRRDYPSKLEEFFIMYTCREYVGRNVDSLPYSLMKEEQI